MHRLECRASSSDSVYDRDADRCGRIGRYAGNLEFNRYGVAASLRSAPRKAQMQFQRRRSRFHVNGRDQRFPRLGRRPPQPSRGRSPRRTDERRSTIESRARARRDEQRRPRVRSGARGARPSRPPIDVPQMSACVEEPRSSESSEKRRGSQQAGPLRSQADGSGAVGLARNPTHL
jgi:hypothetical protein